MLNFPPISKFHQQGETAIEFKLSGGQSPLLLHGLPFALSFTLRVRVRGPLTAEALRGALDRLRIRHPLLGARLAPCGEGVCFTTADVPPLPLRIVERTSEEDWVRTVEAEIQQAFDYRTGPLCRCVLLRGPEESDLVVVYDHLIADGRASFFALRDLMAFLADPELQPEPIVPKMMRELIPANIRPKILAEAARYNGTPQVAAAGQFSESPAGALRTIPAAWEEGETSALVAACRRRGLKVQAALCAAFTLPFAEREPDAPVRYVEIPVDLRSRLSPPPGEVVGNYISLAVIRLDCGGGDPWEIARRAGQRLDAVTDEDLFTDPLVMMALADHPISRPPVDVRYDLSISNVGRVGIPDRYGPFRLDGLFGPTMGVFLSGHRILDAATFNGSLRCTFTSRDEDAPRLAGRARELLQAMSR